MYIDIITIIDNSTLLLLSLLSIGRADLTPSDAFPQDKVLLPQTIPITPLLLLLIIIILTLLTLLILLTLLGIF